MADGHDRFEETGSGGAFVIGLLAGTVLGAGLGMLFAPKPGNELRDQLSEQAGSLANAASEGCRRASEGYRRASETAGDWVERGRDVYTQTRNVVSRGADEAQRYMREVKSRVTASDGGAHSEAGAGPERG